MLAASRAHGQPVEGFPPAQQARVTQAVRASVELLTEWLGPPPFSTVTVRAARTPQTPIMPGVAEVPPRWPVFERDRSLERSVIAAISRQFWWRPTGAAPPTPFENALIVYTGTRAIHHVLEGSNFDVVRFFGGVIAYPLRPVLLSPPVADPRPRVWLEELSTTGDEARVVRGLLTLERYVGWPTMAQALAALRTTGGRTIDVENFAAVLSSARGTDLTALVQECFRGDAIFDYALDNVQSVTAANALVESSLTLLRTGTGIFAVSGQGDREQSMPILVRFGDGTELRDWFDGAAPATTLIYTAKTAVVYAAIDPELMLLLDVNRSNNTFAATRSIRPLGVRLALHWMAWLQQAMLTYSALV